MTSERRRHRRHYVGGLPVILANTPAGLIDLSGGGALIRLAPARLHRLWVGQRCDLRIGMHVIASHIIDVRSADLLAVRFSF